MRPILESYDIIKGVPQNVVITMHQKPDGDAMGSTLALMHFLKTFGHNVQVVSPTNWADFLDWMPGLGDVIDFEKTNNVGLQLVANANLIFCLDFNVLSRTKKMTECLQNSTAIKLLIDHHREPQTEVFTYGVSDANKSSTCEMVYDFIVDGGFADRINTPIATCIYTGIE
jgi:bifunctional oligoribonuclease and PAP phosphatase NrnA